jgi:hypothetical protein
VPVGETKAEKFERLANLRTNQLLDGLRKLGSLSNKNHYDYSEAEIQTIVDFARPLGADVFLGEKGSDVIVLEPAGVLNTGNVIDDKFTAPWAGEFERPDSPRLIPDHFTRGSRPRGGRWKVRVSPRILQAKNGGAGDPRLDLHDTALRSPARSREPR